MTLPIEDTLPPLPASLPAADVIVIGAGIVGLACAFELSRQGRRVLVLDRGGVAAEASRGNAGALAFTDILPLASPGIVRQAPRWLLDPLGPLALPPRYLPRIAPWLWRFWRASTPARVAASTRVQSALMSLAAARFMPMLEAVGAAHLLRAGGNLHLYESEAAWRASAPGWRVRREHGIVCDDVLGVDRIAALQPGLAPVLAWAVFTPHWHTVRDPLEVARALARGVRGAGGALHRAEVRTIVPRGEGVGLALHDGRRLDAATVVLAAGAWSHHLARTLGERVPLETERGYNTTLPAGAFALQRQLTFPEHGFVVTPIGEGVRIGGAVELGGLKAAPNYARADALLAKARRFLPTLRPEGGAQWMGCRPSLPDSLPVIGRAAHAPRVVYAFGHGHLGLTQSAATAVLVRELISDTPPSIDLRPLASTRF